MKRMILVGGLLISAAFFLSNASEAPKGNKITIIPPTLMGLQKLKFLCNVGVGMTEFPSTVCANVNLEQIDFSNNEIPSIPDGISNLKKLSILNLSDNKISHLPINELSKLAASLKKIILTKNPIPYLIIEELKALMPDTIIEF